MMGDRQDEAVLNELRRVTKLLALIATENQETNTEKIQMLGSVGFQPKEIADMIGTTANTVSTTLYKMRSKGKAKKTEQEKKP